FSSYRAFAWWPFCLVGGLVPQLDKKDIYSPTNILLIPYGFSSKLCYLLDKFRSIDLQLLQVLKKSIMEQ
ncbi:hypothetical protein ACTQ5K_24700, partial [Niallia sp. Sow4_A1]|uniref:hypothetical protein n=1 Tax=Niallia sp. Sow4_A1 TaxID=3438793 RepID=UPI003F9B626B